MAPSVRGPRTRRRQGSPAGAAVPGFPGPRAPGPGATVAAMANHRLWIDRASIVLAIVALAVGVLVPLVARLDPGVRLSVDETAGRLYVESVEPLSPAEDYGIQPGMVAVSVNGVQVIRLPQLVYPDVGEDVTPDPFTGEIPFPSPRSTCRRPVNLVTGVDQLRAIAAQPVRTLEAMNPGDLASYDPDTGAYIAWFGDDGRNTLLGSLLVVVFGIAILFGVAWWLHVRPDGPRARGPGAAAGARDGVAVPAGPAAPPVAPGRVRDPRRAADGVDAAAGVRAGRADRGGAGPPPRPRRDRRVRDRGVGHGPRARAVGTLLRRRLRDRPADRRDHDPARVRGRRAARDAAAWIPPPPRALPAPRSRRAAASSAPRSWRSPASRPPPPSSPRRRAPRGCSSSGSARSPPPAGSPSGRSPASRAARSSSATWSSPRRRPSARGSRRTSTTTRSRS